jgi:hypothetical protein
MKTKAKIAKSNVAPTPVATPVIKPAKKVTGKATTVAAPAAPEGMSKRVTPGTELREWRLVPSQRKAMPGFFLQAGYHSEVNGRNAFTVGFEQHFPDKASAAAALAAKKQTATA